MLGILTRSRRNPERPPDVPFAMNKDSWQAEGLVLWYPTGYEQYNERNLAMGNRQYPLTPTNAPLVRTDGDTVRVRNFVSASSQYCEYQGTPPHATYPLTMAAFYTPDTASGTHDIFSLSRSNANHYFTLRFNTNDGSFTCAAGGSAANAGTTNLVALNGLNHIIGVGISATNRWCIQNGTAAAQSTVSRSPASLDRICMGTSYLSSSPTNFMSGHIADCRLYNRALSFEECAELYQPETRWELYYPLGRKTWSFAYHTAAASTGKRWAVSAVGDSPAFGDNMLWEVRP